MARRTLTAMFDSYERAADAVTQLEAAGIPHSDISIVSNDASHRQHPGADTSEAGTGTGTGASLGTIVGGGAGLLAGLGMLAIPGLGPVVAAGWLASTLLGAGVGAAAGGIAGALTGAGISHEHAAAYAEGVRRGGTLVTARVDDGMASRATEILDRDGTVNMDEREASWRSEGWTGATGLESGTGMGAAGLDTGSVRAGQTVAGTARPVSAPASSMDADLPVAPAGTGELGRAPAIPDEPGSTYAATRPENRGRVRSYDVP